MATTTEVKETQFEKLTRRLVAAGAPPLPGDLVYIVSYIDGPRAGWQIVVDIRTKDHKKLLASVERNFGLDFDEQDVVKMTKEAAERLSIESRLPARVRGLFLGDEE
jgi:hypothetical protein